jgi:phosphate transport system substrate-binding protein
MRRWTPLLLPVLLAWLCVPWSAAAQVEGAGATFPAPLYLEWAASYQQQTGIAIRYDAIGSGAGVERIQRRQVDFAATDAPLSAEAATAAGLLQFPVVIGGVVPVVNIVGIKPGALKLSGEVLGDIYLGKIRKWNDSAITALNPDLKLPNANITVVHRSDSSGSSFLWSSYLSQRNAEWRTRMGRAQMFDWPVGVGGKGNEGVASFVQRTRVSIGYVEYAYAKSHRLSHVAVRNQSGAFVQPGVETFAAAAASAHWDSAAAFNQVLTDAPGAASWPITGASFALLPAIAETPARSMETLRFLHWALERGQLAAQHLDYVAASPELVRLIESAWATGIRDAAGNAVWPP